MCAGDDKSVLSQPCPAKRRTGDQFSELTCRSRSDHVMQLQHDIATYFGYNTFLVGKLMKLFAADEVCQSTRTEIICNGRSAYMLFLASSSNTHRP